MNIEVIRMWAMRAFAASAIFAVCASVPVMAAENPVPSAPITLERRALRLERGQTFVIDGVKLGSIPDLVVIENPHALITHGEEPGKFVIMGAERGRWEVKVIRDDGVSVVYDVTVVALADPDHPLEAPPAPPAMDGGEIPAPAASESKAAAEVHDENGGSQQIAVPLPEASGSMPQGSENQPSTASQAPLPVTPVQTGLGVRPEQFRADPPAMSHETPSVSGGPHYLPPDGLWLMTGTSQLVDFRNRMKRISIADSTIADVQVVTPFQLNLIGHKPGFTTLAVWDEQGNYEQREVRVAVGKKQQVLLNTVVAELNRNELENQGINYSVALTKYKVSLFGLPGVVGTPFTAQSTASGTTPVMPGGGTIMPLLLSQNVTYGVAGDNSNVNTQTLFQFLEQHQLARILARPQLLANSGEKANFLSGGEIPIVIAQALNTTIVFKQFGVSVQFVPTVVGSQDIELLVKPEVSQPDYTYGVELFGFQVPAFITRRAETVVRLQDSQTLIIAGLILHDKREVIQKVPYLGDVPYVGGLFRNTNWQDQESDLVMAVTPEIVRPLPPNGQVMIAAKRPPLSPGEIRTTRTATPDAGRPRF